MEFEYSISTEKCGTVYKDNLFTNVIYVLKNPNFISSEDFIFEFECKPSNIYPSFSPTYNAQLNRNFVKRSELSNQVLTINSLMDLTNLIPKIMGKIGYNKSLLYKSHPYSSDLNKNTAVPDPIKSGFPKILFKIVKGTDPTSPDDSSLILTSTASIVAIMDDINSLYDFYLVNCNAHNQMSKMKLLINEKGCSTIPGLIKDQRHGIMPTGEKVSFVAFRVFRFTNNPQISIDCEVQLCFHKCIRESCSENRYKRQLYQSNQFHTQANLGGFNRNDESFIDGKVYYDNINMDQKLNDKNLFVPRKNIPHKNANYRDRSQNQVINGKKTEPKPVYFPFKEHTIRVSVGFGIPNKNSSLSSPSLNEANIMSKNPSSLFYHNMMLSKHKNPSNSTRNHMNLDDFDPLLLPSNLNKVNDYPKNYDPTKIIRNPNSNYFPDQRRLKVKYAISAPLVYTPASKNKNTKITNYRPNNINLNRPSIESALISKTYTRKSSIFNLSTFKPSTYKSTIIKNLLDQHIISSKKITNESQLIRILNEFNESYHTFNLGDNKQLNIVKKLGLNRFFNILEHIKKLAHGSKVSPMIFDMNNSDIDKLLESVIELRNVSRPLNLENDILKNKHQISKLKITPANKLTHRTNIITLAPYTTKSKDSEGNSNIFNTTKNGEVGAKKFTSNNFMYNNKVNAPEKEIILRKNGSLSKIIQDVIKNGQTSKYKTYDTNISIYLNTTNIMRLKFSKTITVYLEEPTPIFQNHTKMQTLNVAQDNSNKVCFKKVVLIITSGSIAFSILCTTIIAAYLKIHQYKDATKSKKFTTPQIPSYQGSIDNAAFENMEINSPEDTNNKNNNISHPKQQPNFTNSKDHRHKYVTDYVMKNSVANCHPANMNNDFPFSYTNGYVSQDNIRNSKRMNYSKIKEKEFPNRVISMYDPRLYNVSKK
ncbi:unnamed protein product [Gordionus sp. m RMFG-2023]